MNRKSLLSASLFLTFTVCLYAPLSIYASNRGEVWFNLRTIWYVPALFFIVAFCLCSGVGLLLKKDVLLRTYLGLIFGAGLSFYIQGNFLCLKLGLMNGNQIDWSLYRTRMMINIAVWVVIVAAAVIICIRFEKAVKPVMYISALLFLMQAVSLTVILSQAVFDKGSVSEDIPILTEKGLYEVGSEENILVFILDAYDEEYFHYVLEEAPEITDEFDGFVFYDNYTSVYPTTAYSLTGMMSNSIFRNEMTKQEWADLSANERTYFDELTDNGYEISIYTSDIDTIPQRIKEETTNYTKAPMKFYNMRTCFSLLYRLAGCQYFPDIVKPYIWMDGTEVASSGYIESEYRVFENDNEGFKRDLDKAGLTVKDDAKEYKFIHLWGAHEPFFIDEWGEETDRSWDWHEPSKGCLRIMLDYMQRLKDAGVYDRSTIIITADHGSNSYPGVLSNPLFMIKKTDEHHPIEICSNEASHINFGATIADLAGADPAPYGLSVIRSTEDTSFDRYYYAYVFESKDGGNPLTENGNYYLVEYMIPDDTNDTSRFELTDVEYTPSGEKSPHRENCAGCKESNGVPEDYNGWNMMMHRRK